MSGDSAGRTAASETQPTLPPFAGKCLTEWMRTIDEEAPGLLLAAFVVGSLAFDDWTEHSDIDVVAVVSEPGDPLTIAKLRAAHKRFTAAQPGVFSTVRSSDGPTWTARRRRGVEPGYSTGDSTMTTDASS